MGAPFSIVVALRFLKEGRTQSTLIFTAVLAGVAVIVFLSALITGLQSDIISKTLGSQAHIVIRAPEETAREVQGVTQGISRLQKAPSRVRSVSQWQQTMDLVDTLPGVIASSPALEGPALAVRASASRTVSVKGILPDRFEAIVRLSQKMRQGGTSLVGNAALVGTDFARRMGMEIGDRFRLNSGDQRGDAFQVTGLFDFGNKDANERLVLISIPAAQALFDLPGGITTIELRVDQIFSAESIAQLISSQTGQNAESWMASNGQLLAALRAQSGSSAMIQFFVVIAVALGISSVLAVSVVQKSKEIGILKAVGVSSRQVMAIFLLQGGLLGLTGALTGSALGWGLAAAFQKFARNADGTALFPLDLKPELFLMATLVATGTGLIAAFLPARRAARLDPTTAIRG